MDNKNRSENHKPAGHKNEMPEVNEASVTPSQTSADVPAASDCAAFDTESGQMAFIEGVEPVKEEEAKREEEQIEQPHPQQIAFVESDEKEKKTKSKAERKPMVKEKKKRGFFYHCCMTLVIFNFVCTVAVLVVGWIIGDQYCRRQLGLSLGETFGVFSGITHSSGKIVDNAYSETDEQGFYDELGGALLLKDNAIDSEDFLNTLDKGLNEGDGNLGEVMLDYVIDKVLVKENLDEEKIQAIDIDNPISEDTMLTITDKELGAFVNGLAVNAIDSVLKKEINAENSPEYLDVNKLNFKEYIKINQIKFFEKEYGGANVDMMRATASVNFSNAISDVNSALDIDELLDEISEGGLPGPLKGIIKSMKGIILGLIKAILPSKLYLTVDIGLSQSVEPTIYINNMSDGKMENFYTLLNIAGLDIKNELNKLFVEANGGAKSLIDDINEAVDLGKAVSPGKISCDIYNIIIGVSGINNEVIDGETVEKPIDKRVTSADILGTMKLVLSDSKPYVDDFKTKTYSYKSYKIVNGVLEFDEKRYDAVTGTELDNLIDKYKDDILKAFVDGYGLDENVKLDDLIDKLSSGDGIDAIMDLFDAEKIKSIIDNPQDGVQLNDRMLAALFMHMLPDLLEGSKEEGGMEIKPGDVDIEFIYIEKRPVSGIDHYMFNVALSVKFKSLTSKLEDATVSKLVDNLLADNIIITMSMDITTDIADGDRLKSEIMLNGLKAKAIDRLMLAVDAFPDENGNALSLGEFLDANVLSEVRAVIDGLADTLPGLSFGQSKLILPDIFTAITGIVNENIDSKLSETEVKNALKLVINDGPLSGGEFAVFGTSAYYEQLFNSENAVLKAFDLKYGISNTYSGKTYTLSQVLAILGLCDKVKTGLSYEEQNTLDFYSLLDVAKIEQNAFDQSADWRTKLGIDLINKTLLDKEDALDMFSAVIRSVVFNSDGIDLSVLGSDFDKEDLLYAKIVGEGNKRYLTIAIRANLANLLPTDMEDDSNRRFIVNLLPDSDALIELKVEVTEGALNFSDSIIINGDKENSETLLKMLNSLGVDINKNLSTTCGEIRDAFNRFNNQITGIEYDTTHSIVRLPNVFSLINSLVLKDDNINDGDVKAALKGIYSTSETEIAGKKRIESFEDGVKNNSSVANADYSAFMDDIKAKFYLKGRAAAATTFDELCQVVTVNGFDTSYLNIDGKDKYNPGLAYDTTPIEQLKPIIGLQDLGAIMKEKVANNDYEIFSVDIRADESGNTQLIIYVKVGLKNLFGDNESMNKLINVFTIFVEVTVHIDDSAIDRYDCDMVINAMPEADQRALFEAVGAISDRSAADVEADLNKVGSDVGKAVYDAIKKLKSSLSEVEFKTDGIKREENGIILNDVFSFLRSNFCASPKESTTSEQIRNALQGLYEYDNSIGNSANYKRESILRNKIAQPIKSSGDYLKLLNKVTSGSAITDSEFGSVVNYMSQNNSKVSQISQFNILAGGGLGQNRKKDISHLAELGYNLNNNSTFVLMTMNVDSKKIMGEGGKQNLITIMPKDIIVTFILEYKSTGFMLQDFIINDMNIASRDALIDLIGIDQSAEEGDTIGKQLKENMKIIKVVLDNFAGDTRQHNFSDNTSSGTVRGYYSAS